MHAQRKILQEMVIINNSNGYTMLYNTCLKEYCSMMDVISKLIDIGEGQLMTTAMEYQNCVFVLHVTCRSRNPCWLKLEEGKW